MSGLTFEQHLTDHPTSDERRAEIFAAPGFGKYFTDHMAPITWTPDAGWHDAEIDALRADHARPGGGRAALRAGDLRGPQGVPARRRLGLDVPAGGERASGCSAPPAGWRCPSCRRRTSSAPSRRSCRSTRRGCPSGAEQSLYLRPFMFASEAFLGVRPAIEITFMVIACPGRRLLPRRRQAGVDLAVDQLHPGGRPAAPARPSAAATTPPAWRRRSRPPRTAATRSPSSTRRSTAGSRSSAA